MDGIYALLILLAGFLSPERTGSGLPDSPPRVVTQIRLEAQDTMGNRQQTYDGPAQMRDLLTWLRLARLRDPVSIDPETFRSGSYRIILELSDGSSALYRQLHREYIQKNNGPWRPMTPGDGLQFPPE